MISLNSPNSSLQSDTGILFIRYVTVQAAADVTGYNIQYLRRLLRSGKLEGIRVAQMWLVKIDSLGEDLKHVETTSDSRRWPR